MKSRRVIRVVIYDYEALQRRAAVRRLWFLGMGAAAVLMVVFIAIIDTFVIR